MKKMPPKDLIIEEEGERIAFGPEEAARLIGYSRNGLYPYLANGDLNSFKVGKKRLIKRSSLLAFLDQMAAKHAASLASSGPSEISPDGDQAKSSSQDSPLSTSACAASGSPKGGGE